MTIDYFYDNFDIVDDQPLKIRALVSVLPTAHGGRSGPFTAGYRPNHNLDGPENRYFYIGQVEVPKGEWVHPGETRELWVTFINARGLAGRLQVGTKWRIQEGAKLVAMAEVLSGEK